MLNMFMYAIGLCIVFRYQVLFAADVTFTRLAHVSASRYTMMKFIKQHQANCTARNVLQVNSILDTKKLTSARTIHR